MFDPIHPPFEVAEDESNPYITLIPARFVVEDFERDLADWSELTYNPEV
jgi:hypothetical protein